MPYHTFKRPPNSSNLCDQYVSENWNQNIDCKEFLQRLPSHKCHDLSFTICQELPRLSQTYMSVIKILVSYWAQKISIRNFLIDILQTMKFSRGRGASSVAGRSHIYKSISLFTLLSSLDVEILMIVNYLVDSPIIVTINQTWYLSIFYTARFRGQNFFTAKVRNLRHYSLTT